MMSDQYFMGIEFGSTRIKAVMINESADVMALGWHTWENQLVDGVWSYDLDEVWVGVQDAFARLRDDYERNHHTDLPALAGIGISAMMHGYLVFNESEQLLVPFRTWRNTMTAQASEELTRLIDFTIPQRWCIAHLYQAVLAGEEHVPDIDFMTSLAGYVHWKLTGVKVLGVGDASGVFPVDEAHNWDQARLEKTQALFDSHGCTVKLHSILPSILDAGANAGCLTEEGARLLDPTGNLRPGVVFCPPEGDAGTGMVATNAVAPRTGNISAGTSIFAMIVLERAMAHLHPEIDIVTTPGGDPVAMVHCNNGASEIDAWARVFAQFAEAAGCPISDSDVFTTLFNAALDGEADGGGLMAYNYLAGETVTGLDQGRPLILRTPDSRLSLANFARTLIMSSFGTLSLGMRILDSENVRIDSMFAHGGLFTTKSVAQRLLAAALGTKVSVGSAAAEGGAWGMAVLAGFSMHHQGLTLTEYLDSVVFAGAEVNTVAPDPADQDGYVRFLAAYEKGLAIQPIAVESS
ncbi:MAG: FGGY-family carbohydrate kinase [Propionibacteriaceae bacterium]|nr:FGGY-family carbohydrate kinase [Propionibacteriaceae bacterium]